MATIARAIPGQVGQLQTSSSFNPLSIPWIDAYWTEGPIFKALGLTDGESMTVWPTETGTGADQDKQLGTLNYRATGHASFGNKPAIQNTGSSCFGIGAASISQPWTVVCVAYTTGGTSAHWGGCQSSSASDSGLTRTGFGLGAGGLSHSTLSAAHIVAGLANNTSSEVWIDGSVDASGGTGGTNAVAQRFSFARSVAGAGPFTGYFAFQGYLDRALTAQEKTDLHSWSQSHYGTP